MRRRLLFTAALAVELCFPRAACATGQSSDVMLDLRSHIEKLTGRLPLDCGQHTLTRSDSGTLVAAAQALEHSAGCAQEAASRRKPFWTVVQRQGIDSWVADGLLGTADGTIYRFFYDSAPCGGPGCASRFTTSPCRDPTVRPNRDGVPSFSCQSKVPHGPLAGLMPCTVSSHHSTAAMPGRW